ncbi:MAG: hypothetical protein IT242_03410 [Bacteroidia bacterium]|nr:hypothetical protein [Bacteroidia bacterium]
MNEDKTTLSYSRDLFFSGRYCDVFYNRDLGIVQTEWKGVYVSGAEFRKVLDQIVDLLKLKNASIVLADARKMQVIKLEDQDWIVQDWYPRAIAAGFRIQALVVTHESFNERSIHRIVERYDLVQIKTAYFTDVRTAVSWIQDGSPE